MGWCLIFGPFWNLSTESTVTTFHNSMHVPPHSLPEHICTIRSYNVKGQSETQQSPGQIVWRLCDKLTEEKNRFRLISVVWTPKACCARRGQLARHNSDVMTEMVQRCFQKLITTFSLTSAFSTLSNIIQINLVWNLLLFHSYLLSENKLWCEMFCNHSCWQGRLFSKAALKECCLLSDIPRLIVL